MRTADIKLFRVKHGLPHFAHVALKLECPSATFDIVFSCSGTGFTSQGYVEEVPAIGYDNWKSGARVGVVFALSVAGMPAACVDIIKIEGLTTDTNPTIVGYAAALAIWKALTFEPSIEIIEKMEAIVFSSWKRPIDDIPTFA